MLREGKGDVREGRWGVREASVCCGREGGACGRGVCATAGERVRTRVPERLTLGSLRGPGPVGSPFSHPPGRSRVQESRLR